MRKRARQTIERRREEERGKGMRCGQRGRGNVGVGRGEWLDGRISRIFDSNESPRIRRGRK